MNHLENADEMEHCRMFLGFFLVRGKQEEKGQMILAHGIQNNTSSEGKIQSSFLWNNKAHLSQMDGWGGGGEKGISHVQPKWSSSADTAEFTQEGFSYN